MLSTALVPCRKCLRYSHCTELLGTRGKHRCTLPEVSNSVPSPVPDIHGPQALEQLRPIHPIAYALTLSNTLPPAGQCFPRPVGSLTRPHNTRHFLTQSERTYRNPHANSCVKMETSRIHGISSHHSMIGRSKPDRNISNPTVHLQPSAVTSAAMSSGLAGWMCRNGMHASPSHPRGQKLRCGMRRRPSVHLAD